MPRHRHAAVLAATTVFVLAVTAPARCETQPDRQHARLAGLARLRAATFRPGSPASGAHFSATERAVAEANGVSGPDRGPYLAEQPVQGFSSMVPGEVGSWWALADNGFAWRDNSADFQLAMYRVEPRWESPGGVLVLETMILHDPDRHIPWVILCDPDRGAALPDLSFNVMPPPPAACGADPAARVLTGFDLDPESFVRAPDGTFWIGEEFGPFLLHVAADGRLLEPPIGVAGVRSPQHPGIDLSGPGPPEQPTVAASRGFEGLAISPDGRTLYALLEGAVVGDDPQNLRLYVFDLERRAFLDRHLWYRLELPSQSVDLTKMVDGAGVRVFPKAVSPPAGAVSIGEAKAVNDHQLLVIERDNHGDDLPAPRFKKLFLVDLASAGSRGGFVGKTLLVDLLAIADPDGIDGDGGFFQLPFYTIESVHVVDERTLLVASDNNFPFSNGRARARAVDRSGPLAADDTELALIRLGEPLAVDGRLLPAAGR